MFYQHVFEEFLCLVVSTNMFHFFTDIIENWSYKKKRNYVFHQKNVNLYFKLSLIKIFKRNVNIVYVFLSKY